MAEAAGLATSGSEPSSPSSGTGSPHPGLDLMNGQPGGLGPYRRSSLEEAIELGLRGANSNHGNAAAASSYRTDTDSPKTAASKATPGVGGPPPRPTRQYHAPVLPCRADFGEYYPDGGWGWVVCGAAFLVHFLGHGLHLAAGTVGREMIEKFDISPDHAGKWEEPGSLLLLDYRKQHHIGIAGFGFDKSFWSEYKKSWFSKIYDAAAHCCLLSESLGLWLYCDNFYNCQTPHSPYTHTLLYSVTSSFQQSPDPVRLLFFCSNQKLLST